MRRVLLFAVVFLAGAGLAVPKPQEDCWGKDQKCSDGKYHDSQGNVQPDSCDNFGATGASEVHDCNCGKAMQHKDDCDSEAYAGDKCKTYCREHACKCKSMECS